MAIVQRRGDYFIVHPVIPQAFGLGLLLIILLIISWVVVGLRFLARWRIRSFGRDDWYILGAQIFYSAVIAFAMANHVLVPGAFTTSNRNYDLFIYMYMSSVVSYAFGMICLKVSLGFFFLRLLVTTEQRYTVYAIVSLACVVNMLMIFVDIFFCGNPKDMPDRVYYGGCIPGASSVSLNYFQASINALSDVSFACLPFWLLHRSLMPKKVRLYVYVILGLASSGCVASIVRFIYVVGLFSNKDFSKSVVNLAIISVVELGTGIIASSLATLKPLISSLQSAKNTKKSTGGIGSSGKPGKLYDFSASSNTGYSQSITAVGTMQSDSIDITTGKLSSLSTHAKPWASVDIRPASSKSRRLFGIELDGGDSTTTSGGYNGNSIFELPAAGAGAPKHISRTHDFALALPDPDAPSEEGEEYGCDLDKISPGIPSPALLLPGAAPISSVIRGGHDIELATVPAPTVPRYAPPPLRLPTNKRLPPTPAAAAELDRRRHSSISRASDDAPPSSEYEDDDQHHHHPTTTTTTINAQRPRRPVSAHDLATSPPRSEYGVALDDLDLVVDERDDAGDAAESATIYRRRGDENHMTFLADESDEEASAWRKSRGAVELRSLEPAHVQERWRT